MTNLLMNPTQRFQQEVAKLLDLPHDCGAAAVRQALLKKGGPDYLTWYDTRLRAISESRQHTPMLERPRRSARHANRRS